jgi:hypothetical protein
MKRLAAAIALILMLVLGNVSAAQTTSTATFGWTADTATVSGYKLYWGTASRVYGTPTDCKNVTTYKLTGLPVAGPLYVAVTAYNSATSTAAYQESGYSPELVAYMLTVSSDSNSTITPTGMWWAATGSSQTFTVTPKTGYVSQINIDGAIIGVVSGTSYTLSGITANHTVAVVSVTQIPAPTGLGITAGQ